MGRPPGWGGALLALGTVASLAAPESAAVAAPPAWSGVLGSATASQDQWSPFISRYINYQYNTTLTPVNNGFNMIGAFANVNKDRHCNNV